MSRASRSGKSANTLMAGTHRAQCSSSSYLARSISTFFWAASFVQTRKHAEERAARCSEKDLQTETAASGLGRGPCMEGAKGARKFLNKAL